MRMLYAVDILTHTVQPNIINWWWWSIKQYKRFAFQSTECTDIALDAQSSIPYRIVLCTAAFDEMQSTVEWCWECCAKYFRNENYCCTTRCVLCAVCVLQLHICIQCSSTCNRISTQTRFQNVMISHGFLPPHSRRKWFRRCAREQKKKWKTHKIGWWYELCVQVHAFTHSWAFSRENQWLCMIS